MSHWATKGQAIALSNGGGGGEPQVISSTINAGSISTNIEIPSGKAFLSSYCTKTDGEIVIVNTTINSGIITFTLSNELTYDIICNVTYV